MEITNIHQSTLLFQSELYLKIKDFIENSSFL